MRPDQHIAINTLLLEREECFLRVHTLEAAAARILGEPYPFNRPSLPSDGRAAGRKKAGPRPGAAATHAVSGTSSVGATTTQPQPRLRKLDDNLGEVTYRVTYREHGKLLRETHTDPAALEVLLASQEDTLLVERIETLDTSDAVRATLWCGPIASPVN